MKKLIALSLLFKLLVAVSVFLCLQFSEYKWLIFIALFIPSIVCMGIISFLIAVEQMNHDKRKHG